MDYIFQTVAFFFSTDQEKRETARGSFEWDWEDHKQELAVHSSCHKNVLFLAKSDKLLIRVVLLLDYL